MRHSNLAASRSWQAWMAPQRTATLFVSNSAGLNGKINTPAGFDQMAAGDETWPHLLPKLAKQVTFCTPSRILY